MFTYQNKMVQKSQERAYNVLEDSANEQITTFKIALDGKYEIIEAFARTLAAKKSFDAKEIVISLNDFVEVANFPSMGYADRDGKAYLNDGKTLEIADRKYFNEALKGKRAIEKILKDEISEQSRFLISVPIEDESGIKGIIFASYLEENFRKFLIPQAFSRTGYSYLCDANGDVILESDKSNFPIYKKNIFQELKSSKLDEEYNTEQLISNVSNRRPGRVSYTIAAQRRHGNYQPLGINDWILFNVVPDSFVNAEVKSIIRSGQVSMFIVILSAIFLILFIIALDFKLGKTFEAERQKLRVQEEEYRIAASQSGKLVFRYDIKTKTQYNQPEMTETIGIPTIQENVPETFLMTALVAEESKKEFRLFYDAILRGDSVGTTVVRIRNSSGELVWYRAVFTTVYSDSGEALRAIVSLDDFSIQREKELVYKRWQQKLNSIEDANLVYYEFNLTKDICELEEGGLISHIVGKIDANFSTMLDYALKQFVFPDDIALFAEFFSREGLIAKYYSGDTAGSIDFRMKTEGKSYRWLNGSVQMTEEPYSTDIKGLFMFEDIDARKRAELLLDAQAKEDPLTGVLNRNEFICQMTELISRGKSLAKHAFIMIDIDNFKQINDTHGHDAGDRLLIDMANNLKKLMRSGDLLGRLGGDEFMICLKDIPTEQVIEKRAELICQMIHRQVTSKITITASLGIALFPRDGTTFIELYKKADVALYKAKEDGRNRFRLYSNEIKHSKSKHIITPIERPSEQTLSNQNKSIEKLVQQQDEFFQHYSAEESYRTIIEGSVDALIEWNVEKGTFYRSPGFAQFEMSKLTNEKFFDIETPIPGVHSEDEKIFRDFYSRHLKTVDPILEGDFRILKKEGSYILCRIRSVRIRDSNNKLKRVVVTIKEIQKQ